MGRAYEKWRELCDQVQEPDGLPTWEEAGVWTRDKLYFWKRYVDITTNAMARKSTSFPGGLVYVDLFGGAGICTLKGTGERFPGSALIAASAEKPFRKIIICEKDPGLAAACEERLSKTPVANGCRVLTGDCNQLIRAIVREIPDRALTLAFIDPKGLDTRFETVKVLGPEARTDFVVLFADAYDAVRNNLQYYWDDPNSKLDETLGPDSNWREKLKEAGFPTGLEHRRLFADIYTRQLQKHLGYTVFREKRVKSGGRPLYLLIYGSRHELGRKFWDEACKEDSSGQKELF